MEKGSYSEPEKDLGQLKIFISADFESLENLTRKNVEYVNRADLADVLVHPRQSKIVLRQKTNSNLHEVSLPYSENNLSSAIGLMEEHHKKQRTSNSKMTSFEKAVEKNINLNTKLNQSRTKVVHCNNENHNKIVKTLSKISNFHDKLRSLNSLEELLQQLLTIKNFKHYEACQIIIHEKGKPISKNYVYGRQKGNESSEFAISDFNSLFSIIKKSKNKLFTQSQLLKSYPGVLGTFLARTFELKKHNIIFLISRNDFLPATSDEQELFYDISFRLTPVFDRLLFKEQLYSKHLSLISALEKLPIPTVIIDELNNIEFHNDLFPSHSFSSRQLDEFITENSGESFPLARNRRIVFFKQHRPSITSDIYHFQRISLLGELLNTLQHELSNPLFGLRLASDLLETTSSCPDKKDILKEISNNCSRSQKIIESFSCLYNDEETFSTVDLKKLISETVTLTKSATKHIRKDLQYNNDQDSSIQLLTNPTWLTQIIFNLIINSAQAINSASEDTISDHKISVAVDTQKSINKSKVLISISDTGPGIPKNHINKIFSPFFTTKSKGTGLGLSICNNLAKKLGGSISFKNNVNNSGATFILSLPMQHAEL